jgi:limonene-1,2-epoxide hydrolase
MTGKSPLEVVEAFMAAMAVKDYDNGLIHVAEGCVYDNKPMGRVEGPAGVRAVLEPFFAPTLENEFVILRQATQGAVVFMERLDRHRIAEGWVELPVTGVWEVHDGKITMWSDYFDLATLTRAWPALAAQTQAV